MRLFATCILVLIFITSHGQSIKKSKDKFTGDSIFTASITATNTFIQMSYTKGHRDIFISFKYLKSACVDDNARVFFLFTDDTKADDISAEQYNCDGSFILTTGKTRTTEMPNLLTEKLIKSIRLTTIKTFVDFDLSRAQANLFKTDYKYLHDLWERSSNQH